MRMLRVFIDEADFSKFGFMSNDVSFSELKEKISIANAKESLLKCHQIAEESGLSEITPEEINAEIQPVGWGEQSEPQHFAVFDWVLGFVPHPNLLLKRFRLKQRRLKN